MAQRLSKVVSLLIALFAIFSGVPARAHEFKLDAVINAFVTTEPGEAHLVVRAPLYLFKSAKFPVNGAEVDVPQSEHAVERALAALQQDVALFEDGRRLTASNAILGGAPCSAGSISEAGSSAGIVRYSKR